MSRKELLSKLRRARLGIDQGTAEVAKEEGVDVVDEQARKDLSMARAQLQALEFRVNVIEGRA